MSLRFLLPAGAAALALAACSPVEDTPEPAETGTVENTNDTLAGVLAEMPNSESIREAVEEGGLASLMDGSGVYTLLAPTDAAFAALGQSGQQLMEEDQRPLLVGLLREHILPGHITPETITAAIDQRGSGVEMTTLGGGVVTFTRDGDALVVTDAEGRSARFAGAALAASNGTVIPIDAVLVPAQPAAGSATTAAAQ